MTSKFFLALGMAALLAAPALAQDTTSTPSTGSGQMNAATPSKEDNTTNIRTGKNKKMTGGKHNRRSHHHATEGSRQTENTPTNK